MSIRSKLLEMKEFVNENLKNTSEYSSVQCDNSYSSSQLVISNKFKILLKFINSLYKVLLETPSLFSVQKIHPIEEYSEDELIVLVNSLLDSVKHVLTEKQHIDSNVQIIDSRIIDKCVLLINKLTNTLELPPIQSPFNLNYSVVKWKKF
ncbi:unnamed protein product [Heterobilharzia americana]|nr:unnamed protein product [Heterobilharzia americana]